MSNHQDSQQSDDDAVYDAFLRSTGRAPNDADPDPEYDSIVHHLFPGRRRPDPAA